MKNKTKRFFLSTDNSSHWYLIPLDKSNEWDNFNNLDEDNPKSWEVPNWAKRIGGNPSSISFCDPK